MVSRTSSGKAKERARWEHSDPGPFPAPSSSHRGSWHPAPHPRFPPPRPWTESSENQHPRRSQHFIVVWIWESFSISLGLSFPTCQVALTPPALPIRSSSVHGLVYPPNCLLTTTHLLRTQNSLEAPAQPLEVPAVRPRANSSISLCLRVTPVKRR